MTVTGKRHGSGREKGLSSVDRRILVGKLKKSAANMNKIKLEVANARKNKLWCESENIPLCLGSVKIYHSCIYHVLWTMAQEERPTSYSCANISY